VSGHVVVARIGGRTGGEVGRLRSRVGSELGDGRGELHAFAKGDDVNLFEEVQVELKENVAGDLVLC
jgi:hypothetical protein